MGPGKVNGLIAHYLEALGITTGGVYAAAIGDWTAYTPTCSWVSNVTVTAFYRTVGKEVQVTGMVECSGAPTSAVLTITLPAGVTVATTKFPQPALGLWPCGTADIYDDPTAAMTGRTFYEASSGKLRFGCNTVANPSFASTVTQASPVTFGANDAVYFTASLPIV